MSDAPGNPKRKRDLDMVVRGHHEWAAFGIFIAELEKEIGWATGYRYTGHTIKKKGDSWLLVVRVDSPTGKLVTFVDTRSPIDCFRLLYSQLYKTSIKWRKDMYS